MTCTTLDHCYPQRADGQKPADGTPCLCGKRRWNWDGTTYSGPVDPPKRAAWPLRKGQRVELKQTLGCTVTVTEVDREARMFKINDGQTWFDVEDLV